MRTPRVYVDDKLESDLPNRLDSHAHHHLVHVLRLKPGTRIRVFNGRGIERYAIVTQADRRGVSVNPGERVQVDAESTLHTTILQAVLRGDRMDFALQKAVELGINHIRPVWTENSEKPFTGERLERRRRHWLGVVVSACEQCGRSTLPRLDPPLTLTEALAANTVENAFVLDPVAPAGFPDTAGPLERLTVACGPESGLSGNEIERCTEAGFRSVRLGPRTLRAETAGIAALAAAQALWGDFRTHVPDIPDHGPGDPR